MGEILIPGAREREKGGGGKGQLQGRKKGGKDRRERANGICFFKRKEAILIALLMGVELSNCKKTLIFFIYRYMVRRFYSLNLSGRMQYALDSSILPYIFRLQKQRGRAPEQLPFSEKKEGGGRKKKVYGDSFERLGPAGCFRREQKMRRARVMGGSFSPGSLQTTKNLDLFRPKLPRKR